LLQFGTGPIKGFAVTLIIGLVSNVVTAVFMARIAFDYLYVFKRWKTISI
jgi:preprotein translocase subunit SecD